MITIKPTRCCCVCNKELVGRRDKVFCNIICKNKHHCVARIQTQSFINEDKILKRNNIILEGMFGKCTKKLKVYYKLLFKVGFDLKSSESKIKLNGKTYWKIGNFCFKLLKNDSVEIVRINRRENYISEFFERWNRIFFDYGEIQEIEVEKNDNLEFERLAFF